MHAVLWLVFIKENIIKSSWFLCSTPNLYHRYCKTPTCYRSEDVWVSRGRWRYNERKSFLLYFTLSYSIRDIRWQTLCIAGILSLYTLQYSGFIYIQSRRSSYVMKTAAVVIILEGVEMCFIQALYMALWRLTWK